MQAVGRLRSYISQGVYTVSAPFHPFGGAVDIVVVEQPDGTFKSSPWYVRFGKFQGVLKAKEKVVSICVNDVDADFQMYLDHKGEAFFLREIDGQDSSVLVYPSSPGDLSVDSDDGKVVARSGSRRSRILGLVFGRRSLKREVEEEEDGGDDGIENRVDSLERAEIAADLLDLKWSTNLSGKRNGDSSEANEIDNGFLYQGEINRESDLNGKEVVACVEIEARQEKGSNGEEVPVVSSVHVEEVIKNDDLGMPVVEVSEFHSRVREMDCSDSDVSLYSMVGVVEDLTTSPKPQIVDVCVEHCSSEDVDLNCVTKLSSYASFDDQGLDEDNVRDRNVSSLLSSPRGSLGDCLTRNASGRSPSLSSEEVNFLFDDLDERRINDRFERSFTPDYADKEDHLSSENGTSKLRETSSPIVIPRNEVAGEEVGQLTGSLPNISSGSNRLDQHHPRYPLSQSLDSKSASFLWTFPGKDDLKCPKSDEDKENQLSHEEPDAEDYPNSGELPNGDPSTHNPSPGGKWRLWPFSLRRSGSRNPMLPPTPSDAKSTSFDSSSEYTISSDVNKNEAKPTLLKKKVRETTPTSEQLASLNLKEGSNSVTFTFSTAMLGKQQVDARIFLWKWNTRIVISDVDGTITKSDVLGQFMPLVGYDWSQTGVTHLFSAIKENGYQLLFLSARSISQAYLTRQFLVNLKQDGKVLPDGPVVISPDGLFPSLYREVIRRVPHEFKIACLEDIKALFPSDCNPFYAGFGNRDTDEISYLKVGIPKGKIFIINPKGEVVVNRRLDSKSYTSLHALVNGMFPPTNSSEQEDFNSWNFWKLPSPATDM